MKRMVTLLTDGFADWETALLNAVARSYYGAETHFASPGGLAVVSSGGMQVVPGLAMEAIDFSDIDALVICGGTIWQSDNPPDIKALVQAARESGCLVAGICDGTVALARTGLLDGLAHTSNGVGYLDGTGYGGTALYEDQPGAISADGVVTAPATAPVGFMAAVMRGLGLADDNLDFYVGMHAAEHGRPAAAA